MYVYTTQIIFKHLSHRWAPISDQNRTWSNDNKGVITLPRFPELEAQRQRQFSDISWTHISWEVLSFCWEYSQRIPNFTDKADRTLQEQRIASCHRSHLHSCSQFSVTNYIHATLLSAIPFHGSIGTDSLEASSFGFNLFEIISRNSELFKVFDDVPSPGCLLLDVLPDT